MKKTTKSDSKKFYAFGTYKPNKNAVPVEYNGKKYLSKAQCMALEGITRKELDAYLNGKDAIVPSIEEVALEENYNEQDDELHQDVLASNEVALDDLV